MSLILMRLDELQGVVESKGYISLTFQLLFWDLDHVSCGRPVQMNPSSGAMAREYGRDQMAK